MATLVAESLRSLVQSVERARALGPPNPSVFQMQRGSAPKFQPSVLRSKFENALAINVNESCMLQIEKKRVVQFEG